MMANSISTSQIQVKYTASLCNPHTKEQISSIEKIQRRADKVVLNDYRKTSSVTNMLKELDWPTLENRCKASRLTTLYKIRKGAVKVNTNHHKPAPTRSYTDARPTVSTIHMQEGCTPLRFPLSLLHLTQQDVSVPSADAFHRRILHAN